MVHQRRTGRSKDLPVCLWGPGFDNQFISGYNSAMETKNLKKWLIPAAPRPGQWKRWLLARLATLFLTFSVLLLGLGFIFGDRLMFYPTADIIDSPAHYGLKVEEFQLELADGTKLRTWLLPAAPAQTTDQPHPDQDPPPKAGETIKPVPGRSAPAISPFGGVRPHSGQRIALVFQGNSGNISMMTSRLVVLHSLGLAALTVDYPGYGPNEGSPSEAKTYQSAEAAWQWAVGQGYRPEDILIYGYSLGGGVASYLADRHPPAALVLDSTFTRVRDVPSRQFPWLSPYFYLILSDAFDTRTRLERIHCPLLVLHSPNDEVVPFALGQEIFKGYRNNYKDMAVGRGGHTDFVQNRSLFQARIKALLAVAWPPEPERP